MASFADRVKYLRKEKGLLQRSLADELSVSLDTISTWERGIRKPDFSTMERVADYFHTSLAYLMGNTDERYCVEKQDVDGWLAAGEQYDEDSIESLCKRFAQLSDSSRCIIGAAIQRAYSEDKARGLLHVDRSICITVNKAQADAKGNADATQ